MKSGALVPDASGEIDAKIHLTNGEAALVASGELEPLLMHDAPSVCVSGGVCLTMRSGCGSVAFAGASLQTHDGTGLVAFFGTALRARRGTGLAAAAAASRQMSNRTGLVASDGASLQLSDGLVAVDGAFLWRSDEPELGASGEASLQKNNGVGFLWPDDLDKCPQNRDLVARGVLLAVATGGGVMEQNVTDVGGDDYDPVVVPDAS